MRVLVTGGGGYLGYWIVKKLLAKGHAVRLFDRFCFGQEPFAPFADDENCEIITGDIRRLQDSPGLLDGIEGVIHLASISNAPSCNLDTEMTTDVNVQSTVALARLAREAHVPRFVFASSCSVYGRGVFELLDEESPATPASAFGQSKLAAERALLAMRGETFEPVISRAATLFGCSARMRFDLALNEMTATAMRQGRIIVRGGGNQWRPFVHVRDAARAMIAMLEAPAELVAGEVFNTGTDIYNLRVLDLAQRVARHFKDIGVEVVKEEDPRNFRVQFGKIRNRLNFMCQWSIDEGIDEIKKALEDPHLDPFSSRYFNVDRMKELMQTPVDQGGEPVAARFIPLSEVSLCPEEEEAVLSVLRNETLAFEPRTSAFEKAFSETVSAPHTVAVSSCTAALHLCLADLGVGPGDEVVISPISNASVGNVVLQLGAKIVFADVEPETMNMAPQSLESVITPRTKVILPTHMAGRPCGLDAIRAIAAKHGIAVVENAAHALGAKYKGIPIGNSGNLTCFSLDGIKNIAGLEGGMIALTEDGIAERLRILAANGMAAAENGPECIGTATSRRVVMPGYKYAMNNVSAAIGLEQLKKFPALKAARERIAHMYRQVLADIEEVRLPTMDAEIEHAWRLFIIHFKLEHLNKTRDELAADLRKENIGTGVHFYGLHLHPYYRDALGFRPEDLPEATRASNEILSIPFHPQLDDKNMQEVVAALKKVIVHAKRR